MLRGEHYRRIAGGLVGSKWIVDVRLERVLGKLEFDSRVQVALWFQRRVKEWE